MEATKQEAKQLWDERNSRFDSKLEGRSSPEFLGVLCVLGDEKLRMQSREDR
jgi:hypothetical protein